jgi:hypothetical protein
MAKTNIELGVLQRQLTDLRLRFGNLDGRVNQIARDIRVLLTMAQNQDEAMKDLNHQLGEMIGVFSGRFLAIEERQDRQEQ